MSTDKYAESHVKLQLNASLHDVEDCWRQGYEQSANEVDESANPYQAGSKAHQYWQDGWWAAFYGEEPLFEQAEVAVNQAVTLHDQQQCVEQSTPQNIVWRRFLQAAGALTVGMLCYQLADMAV